MKPPIIFKYLNYRSFLKDMFEFRKKMHDYFSYRYFSSKSGFASPNFLKLVTSGKRNLTNNSIPKIAKGFELKKKEREFFENMVFMNQATTHDERNHYYKKMMTINGNTKAQKIAKAQYDYFSKWYYPVIREIVTFGDCRHTPESIATLLNPRIKSGEVKKALKLLADLKLIKKDENGYWEQCEKKVTTGPEVKSLVVTNFHKEMLKLATEAIERHSQKERDITALTLGINGSKIPDIKKMIATFRKELLNMACDDEDSDQVIQINIQAFPLTIIPGKEKK